MPANALFMVPQVTDLDVCAQESGQLPVSIQSHGCLLACNQAGQIVQVSANSPDWLGASPAELLGKPVEEFLDSRAMEALQQHWQTLAAGEVGVVDALPGRAVLCHQHANLRVLEVFPFDSPNISILRTHELLRTVSDLLQQGTRCLEEMHPLEEFGKILVEQTQKFLGYDRVLLYRFDPDWTGRVIAEVSGGGAKQYLGLCFPAANIPASARELYLRNRIWGLADAQAAPVPMISASPAGNEPLDLSYSWLRSISPAHRDYLLNLGIRACLVVSIVYQNRLWGMLTCHHLQARIPTLLDRSVLQVLAETISDQIGRFEFSERVRSSLHGQRVLQNLEERQGGGSSDWASVLTSPTAGLLEVIPASGFSIHNGTTLHCRGDCPDEGQIRRLVSWLDGQPESIVVTNQLAEVEPALADLSPRAAGVLALRVPHHDRSWIMWFRPEQTQTVAWAADPRKTPGVGADSARASSRTSFASWLETVHGHSIPWTTSEIAIVTEAVRPNLLDVLLAIQGEQARQKEQHYQYMLAQVNDAVVVIDLKGVVTFWNEGATQLFGWTAEEMVGRLYADRFVEPERGIIAQGIREMLTSERPFQGEWLDYRKDGSRVWIDTTVHPVRGENGTPTHIVGISRDISVRKMAEKALQESEARYRLVTETIQDIVCMTDPQGEILFVSPSVERVLGLSTDSLIGHNLQKCVHPDDLPKFLRCLEMVRAGRFSQLEWRCRHRDGRWVWMETYQNPILNSNGELTHIVCCTRDISQRKTIEEQYRQSQKLEAIGQLAGGVAHDFNNLLTVVNGYSELALQMLDSDHPARGLIQEVVHAGFRGAGLTQQLLAFSRKQILRVENLDLNAVIVGMQRMLLRLINEDISLETELVPNLPLVRGDSTQLSQVLINLVVNARDAMPRGGKLTLATHPVRIGAADAENWPEAHPGMYVRLDVIDTGCGMDRATRGRIFEPFFTTKPTGAGTGLGLSTVHGIVHQHGGFLTVDSEPGQGTSFHLFFPVAVCLQVASADTAVIPPSSGGRETILLVEDDTPLRNLITSFLTASGYRVVDAPSGVEALRIVEEAGTEFDLLLTDIVMPSMNGRRLAEILRARNPEMPVILLSGYTADEVARQGVEEDTVTFLQKPFTPDQLTALVREVLDQHKVIPVRR